MNERQRFAIVFEAQPGTVPAEARLKGILKLALRGYGLRCLTMRRADDEDDPTPTSMIEAANERVNVLDDGFSITKRERR